LFVNVKNFELKLKFRYHSHVSKSMILICIKNVKHRLTPFNCFGRVNSP